MKKVTKILSVMALCVMMVVLSVTPAFAATREEAIEDHSVVDCVNRYREGSNEYHFTIKVPAGTSIHTVSIEYTKDYNGTIDYPTCLAAVNIINTYTDGNSDYYEFTTTSSRGRGIRIYVRYNGVDYRASDTANGDPNLGRGYWLSA